MTHGGNRIRKVSGALVALGVLFTAGAAITYIVRFGARYPYSDDWSHIPFLIARNGPDWKWLWALHGDHLIALPKLIHWLSFTLTADYRTTSLIVAFLFSLLAALAAIVAARIRGHSSIVDLLPAFACFHFAQGYLGWGFQVQFGSSTFLLGLLVVWLAHRAHAGQQQWSRNGLIALTAILMALTISGTNGALPALILSGYFAFRIAGQMKKGADCSVFASVAVIAVLGGIFLSCLIILFGIPRAGPFRAQSIRDAMEVGLHVAISPIGVIVMDTRGLVGNAVPWLSISIIAFAFVLGIKALFQHTNERHVSGTKYMSQLLAKWFSANVDLLVLGGAALSIVLAVGIGRGGRGWEPGLEMHYGVVALPLIFWSYFLLVTRWQNRFARTATIVLSLLFAWTYFSSFSLANRISKLQEERRVAFEQDLKAGRPIDEIIGRHISFLYWVDTPGGRRYIRNGLLSLKAEAVRDNYRRPALKPYLLVQEDSK